MKRKEQMKARRLSLAALSLLMMTSSALPAFAMEEHADDHIHDESCFTAHADDSHVHEHADENGIAETISNESAGQPDSANADEALNDETAAENSQTGSEISALTRPEDVKEEDVPNSSNAVSDAGSNQNTNTNQNTNSNSNREATSFDQEEQPVLSTEFYFNELHEDSVTEAQKQEMEAMPVTEDDSSWTYQAPTVNQDKPVYITMEDAAIQMREYMVNRQEEFTLYVNEPYIDQDGANPSSAKQLSDMAVEHTGNPVEGDYLAWHFEKWTVSVGKYVQSGKFYVKYTVSYYTTPEEEAEVTRTLNHLMAEMPFDSSNVHQSIFNAYSWITDHVRYDRAAAADKYANLHAFTAYGALLENKAVCQGYAILFYRWMLEDDIDCRFISGTASNQAHGWNIVQLDGQWYHVDATWDEGDTTYDYFLRGTQNFKNHTRDAKFTTAEFQQKYPVGTADYAEFTYSLYGEPEWNEDKSKIYITAAGPEGQKPLVKAFEAWVSDEKSTLPTCTESGSVTWQSSGYYMGQWFDETITENLPALGHDIEKTIVWDDKNQAKVTFTCLNNCGIHQTVSASVTELVNEYKKPDCTNAGQRVLLARAELKDGQGNVLDTLEETRIVLIPALGHNIEKSIAWDNDNHAYATFICLNDCGLNETVAADIQTLTEEYLAATCEKDGQQKLQATAVLKDEKGNVLDSIQDVRTVKIPALGHNIEKTITWNNNNQADVTFICLNDCGVHETVSANVVELTDEYQEPDCQKAGQKVLQATAELKDGQGKVLDTLKERKIIVLLKLSGHVREGGICIHCGDVFNPFPDINMNAWVAEHALKANERGLMTGLDDGTFNPYGQVTRGQVLVTLYRMAGQPVVNKRKIFTDVNPDAAAHYFATAVTWAYDNGIAKGYEPTASGTKFGPSDPVTRQQLATFLFNFARYMNLDVSARADLGTYPDANRVLEYGKEPMAWLTGEGMIQGVLINNKWHLAPFDTSNRAQMAKLAVLMDEKLEAAGLK